MNLNDSYNAVEKLIEKYNSNMEYFKKHPNTPLGEIIACKEDILKDILKIGALYILRG